jgi:DNA-binding beta-propeller fold protein YncE
MKRLFILLSFILFINNCQYFTLKPLREWSADNSKTKTHLEFDSMFGTSMDRPAGVAFDFAENIYILNNQVKTVQKYDRNANYISQFSVNQVAYPWGIAIDQDNIIYITDCTNSVLKYNTSGIYLGVFATLTAAPVGITVDGVGLIYIADANGKIHKYNINGTKISVFGIGTQSQGITVDTYGNIYEAGGNNHHIQVYDNKGNLKFKIGTTGTAGTANGQFDTPIGVAVDDNGYICVSERYNHRVQIFDPDGKFITKIGSGTASSAAGEFSQPWGIAIDRFGTIYVTDSVDTTASPQNKRAQKFKWK